MKMRYGWFECNVRMDSVTVEIYFQLQIMSYKKLAELPFDSHRKCMSVIIKETSETGSEHITVFTKGADSAVFPVTIDGPR